MDVSFSSHLGLGLFLLVKHTMTHNVASLLILILLSCCYAYMSFSVVVYVSWLLKTKKILNSTGKPTNANDDDDDDYDDDDDATNDDGKADAGVAGDNGANDGGKADAGVADVCERARNGDECHSMLAIDGERQIEPQGETMRHWDNLRNCRHG